jgi:hypothetical protein
MTVLQETPRAAALLAPQALLPWTNSERDSIASARYRNARGGER